MNKKKKIKWRSQKEIDNYFYLKKLNWIESPCYCSGLVLQKKFHKVLQNLNYSQLRQAAAVWAEKKLGLCRWGGSDPHPLPLAFTYSLSLLTPHIHDNVCKVLIPVEDSRHFIVIPSIFTSTTKWERELFSQNLIQLLLPEEKKNRMRVHHACKKIVECWSSLNKRYLYFLNSWFFSLCSSGH